jgi:hypothetical protein
MCGTDTPVCGSGAAPGFCAFGLIAASAGRPSEFEGGADLESIPGTGAGIASARLWVTVTLGAFVMKNIKLVLALSAFAACIPILRGHGQESKRDLKKPESLMQRKLQHSQKVLEGIAVNDFDVIARNAEELIQISKLGEWKVLRTPQYELHSNDFRRTAETLVQTAKAKNLDGAALAYVDLTMSCVKCHKHVREARWSRRDSEDDREGLPRTVTVGSAAGSR